MRIFRHAPPPPTQSVVCTPQEPEALAFGQVLCVVDTPPTNVEVRRLRGVDTDTSRFGAPVHRHSDVLGREAATAHDALDLAVRRPSPEVWELLVQHGPSILA